MDGPLQPVVRRPCCCSPAGSFETKTGPLIERGARRRPHNHCISFVLESSPFFLKLEQVLVLPISFFGYGSIGIRGAGGSMDGL
jgi:hypothetical protein